MPAIDLFPDTELILVAALNMALPDYRFVTELPSDITDTLARIKRISGAARNVRIDRPVIDIDVFAVAYGDSSTAAREIQAELLGLRGSVLGIGVIQTVNVVVGPRWLPDPNPNLNRFSATYEIQVHS